MAKVLDAAPKLFGRSFDTKTQTWVYQDGSGGAYPEEMRLDLLNALDTPSPNGCAYLGTLFSWKNRIQGATK